MRTLAYLVVTSIILIGSCSPQARMNRIISNHPELQLNDSVYVKTRLLVPARSAVMSMPMERINNLKNGDTISTTTNNITLVIGRVDDSVSFKIRIPASIVEKDTMIPIERINVTRSVKHKKWKRIDWIIFTVLFTGSLTFLAALIRKRKRND